MPEHDKEIKDMIVRAHRAGVCDIDGNHVRDANGKPTKKPRESGPMGRTWRYNWKTGEKHEVTDGI